jgi:methylthioribulose-1-phosphate dehydratase
MAATQNTDIPVDSNGHTNNDHLVQSTDPEHPANLIPEMCRKFYNWGWVTGTGGGVSFSDA